MSLWSSIKKLGRYVDPTNPHNYDIDHLANLSTLGMYGAAYRPIAKKLGLFGKEEEPATSMADLTFDPFDSKIRDAALNDVLLQRRAGDRSSTFVTGPRGTNPMLPTMAPIFAKTSSELSVEEAANRQDRVDEKVRRDGTRKPQYNAGPGGVEGPYRTVLG